MKKAKKPTDYAAPKKAFDDVMSHYPAEIPLGLLDNELSRQLSRDRIAAEAEKIVAFYNEAPVKDAKRKRGQGTIAAKGTAVRNPTAPTMIDFKVDVEKRIRQVIQNPNHMTAFIIRYIFGIEKLTKEEQHLFARYEQQIGMRFIRAGIYPLNKYFVSIREKR